MSDLEQIELSMEQAKEKIELAEALDQLQKNPHFKKVIGEKYLKEYSINLVNRKAHLGFQDEKQQKYIEAQLNAIGHLNQFFGFIMQEGNMAQDALRTDSEEREKILREG